MSTPHPTQTNRRRTHCIECKSQLQPGQGRQVAHNQYVCEICAGVREEQDLAFRYLNQVLERVPAPDRWITRADIGRWVLRSGRICAIVMQAVADRVDMAPAAVDYHGVWGLVREECAMIGAGA